MLTSTIGSTRPRWTTPSRPARRATRSDTPRAAWRERPCRAKWRGGCPHEGSSERSSSFLPIWPKNIDKKMPARTYSTLDYGSPHCFPKNIGVVPRMATTEPMSARGVTGSSFTIFPRGNAYIGPTHMSVEKIASDDTRNNA